MSSHPYTGYEIPPSLVAMVRSQSFSGRWDENPYTHLREFEQNCSIISIPGMHHKIMKWKLFPFSLTGRAKDWYSITVRSVEGDQNILKEEFCLRYFHSSKIVKLRIEALSFEQREEESLGAAWARYTELISSGLDLGIPEAMHIQHFAYGLRTTSATFLDKSSGGSFLHKTMSEAKAILDGILKNTEYTGVYEDPPEEPREPVERAKPFVQSPTPSPQKIVEPEPRTSDPKPFSKDHRPFFLSMFDDDESTVDGDVSSSPREESVTP